MTQEEREMLRIGESMSRDLKAAINTDFDDDQEKFLGFVPPEIGGVAKALFSGSVVAFSDFFREKFYVGAQWAGKRTGIPEQHLNKFSAVAATGAIATVALAPYLEPFFKTQKDHHTEVETSAKRIAPVLDDIGGKHGLSAFAAIKQTDNEVIFAHRKRINDTFGMRYTKNVINTFNAAPVIVEKLFGFNKFIKDKTGESIIPSQLVSSAKSADASEHHAISMNAVLAMVQGPISLSLDAITDRQKKKFESKVPAPYTALDMILNLEKQVSADSNSSSYMFPKGGRNSKGSASLVEYVEQVMRHHQLDMEAIDAEYVPIRKALDNQLRDLATPIAEAIKRGDISTLSLIRLLGEGHVIKNKGRSLAKPSEVKALLEKIGVSASNYTQVDPKEYFADAAFNKKELKEAIDALHGEEKQNFAAMFPDAVLHEAGMSDKAVKELRAATAKSYEANLGKVILGMAAEDDKALHGMGLAKEEIKELRGIAQNIKTQGDEAVHDAASKPNKPIGFERVVAGAAINKIIGGDTGYFGKVFAQATVKRAENIDVFAQAEVGAEAETEAHVIKVNPEKNHAGHGHVTKESHRRDHGSDEHEAAI
jgi:hypothetical protein